MVVDHDIAAANKDWHQVVVEGTGFEKLVLGDHRLQAYAPSKELEVEDPSLTDSPKALE